MRALSFVALLASLLPAAVAAADPLFTDNFENGNGNWSASDGSDVGISSDTAICSTNFQHETSDTAGRTVSTAAMPVTAGDYCLSAWVRASSDATPFLGLTTSDASGNEANRWLIGLSGIDDGYGDQIAGVVGDEMWHWYASPITLDATIATARVVDLFGGNSGYADFDDITLTAGPCAAAYAGADQHQVCGNDAPVCSADGSCQPVPTTGGGDMGGGGSSSTPDMGPPAVSFPGTNVGITPVTPVAAEGTPSSGGGSVMAVGGGGCSMGGSEGERSFGLMLLAFVGVMFFGRRRRA